MLVLGNKFFQKNFSK